jgi:hypothetical protein
MINYEIIWRQTEDFQWCALVTTGRVGSDFFQSLLDRHSEIFVFNGVLNFYEFWEQASTTRPGNNLVIKDVVDEFVGYFIEKFKSRYELIERKNELGDNRDQSIDINLETFKSHLISFLNISFGSRRDFLRAVYLSWEISLNADISKKKLFFHHIHHIWKLKPYLEDFPQSKILAMTRDPRASYVSGVEHWIKYRPSTNHGGHVFFVLKRSIQDALELKKSPNEFKVLRLEDLGDKGILESFCSWVGVTYEDCMEFSTWGGLRWWGDQLSSKKILKAETGFSPTISQNNWATKLGYVEKELFNFLLFSRLKFYGYECKSRPNFLFAIPIFFAIFFLTRYERKLFSLKYIRNAIINKKPRWILASFYCYLSRVLLFLQLYKKRVLHRQFDLPLIKKSHNK